MKKLLAFVLAVVIAIIPVLSVCAETDSAVPIINVHGLMSTEIFLDAQDPDSMRVWPPSKDGILTAVKDTVPALLKLGVTKNWDTFNKELTSIARELFDPSILDPSGTVTNGSGIVFEYPSKDSINKNSNLDFKYDWRIDPIEVASQLNDFIDYVLEASGCSQVNINAHSLGGVITTTYLTVYGYQKVRGVVLNSTAVYGETYTGELLTGKMVIDADALESYLGYTFDNNEYETLINESIKILNDAGVLDIAEKLGNGLLEHSFEAVCAGSVLPLFAGWLSIWAMVPDDMIDEAMDFVFDYAYKNSDVDYSGVKAKVENYNNLVRKNKTQTLKKFNDNANLYVISRYGYSSIPITPSYSVISDGVIDAKYTSFGATVSNYGETLSEDYLASVPAEFVSPDRSIDASTCLFPKQTWFIKDIKHSYTCDSFDEMVVTLLEYDGQATVDTFNKYPRFLILDSENNQIVPEIEAKAPLTFLEKIWQIVQEIIKLFKFLGQKISG